MKEIIKCKECDKEIFCTKEDIKKAIETCETYHKGEYESLKIKECPVVDCFTKMTGIKSLPNFCPEHNEFNIPYQ